MSNALVIGMGGVGSVIGQKLHDYDCFDQIFLADIDPTFAQHLHGKTVDSRFEVATLNAMETQKLAAFMREKKIAVTLNASVGSRRLLIFPLSLAETLTLFRY